MARLASAQTLRGRNQLPAAAAQYVAVFDDAAIPSSTPRDRGAAVLARRTQVAGALVSRRVYQHLAMLPELSPQEQFRVRLYLVECLLHDGDSAAAREQFEACLQSPDLADRDRWDLRLQVAHTYLHAKDYAAARTAYAAIAGNTSAPAEYRSQAGLCFADTYRREQSLRCGRRRVCPGCNSAATCRRICDRKPPSAWRK